MRSCLALTATLALLAAPVRAQESDGIGALLNRIERVLPSGDPSTLRTLLSPNVAPGVMDTFAPRLLNAPFQRATVHEREREPLDGALPGDGFRLTADIFQDGGRMGRIVTARLDVRRAPGDTSLQAWRLVSAQVVTMVDGLHRLAPDATTQFAVEDLAIRSEDLLIRFTQGTAVPVESELGVTGMVIVGAGQVTFTPRPVSERGQVRLFTNGSETLIAPLEAVFVRVHPADLAARGLASGLRAQPVDPRVLRRARDLFEDDAPRSFSLDLGDLSREPWYVLPPRGDFLAELHTRGRGHLTYARSFTDPEDVSLFERARGRDIARYASIEKEQIRGVSYNEDALNEITVLDYDIDATIDPEREFIDARARLKVRVQSAGVSTLSIKLAEPLVVTGAVSPQFGPLVHLRVRGRETVLLNLPVPVLRGTEIVLSISYSGRLRSQAVDQEALGQDGFSPPPAREQDYYLLSTKAYWYPQPQTSGYATATLRLTLPADFSCTASGEPLPGFRTVVSVSGRPMRAWAFRAFEPVRYLSLVAARFRPVVAGTLALVEEPVGPAVRPAEGTREPGFRVREHIPFDQLATPGISRRRQAELATWTADIFRFYLSRMGEAPYSRLTLAAVEHPTPGGHSPAGAALVFNPRPGLPISWRDDPASFEGFPEFFLAHELAHQWWGHGVGWANYHEQWVSEGFAQYFAALYAEHKHGSAVMEPMLRQFRRWTLEVSDQGPISLGYRLGQMKGDRQIFRALVYNKTAGVLHMLRRLIGDDAFFEGLRRLYGDRRLEKAGTPEVQAAFEAAAGRPLGRFFQQWIGDARLPRVRVTQTVTDREAVVAFEHLDGAFDLPVTVSLVYADGRTVDTVVPVTEERVERRLPLDGPLRQVRINRDHAALAVFEGL